MQTHICFLIEGAVDGTRTRDPRLGKPMLYQLSHYRKKRNCFGQFIAQGNYAFIIT